MKLEHTPGPWNVERLENNHPVIISDEDITIAYPQFSLETMGHNEANARLIAAAPDMLEALIKVYNVSDMALRAYIRYFIERATGKPIEEVLQCFNKEDEYFGHDDCSTRPQRDDGKRGTEMSNLDMNKNIDDFRCIVANLYSEGDNSRAEAVEYLIERITRLESDRSNLMEFVRCVAIIIDTRCKNELGTRFDEHHLYYIVKWADEFINCMKATK